MSHQQDYFSTNDTVDEEKWKQDSQMDSGFISSGNLLSSEIFSSDDLSPLESEKDPKVNKQSYSYKADIPDESRNEKVSFVEPLINLDSGVDLEINDGFSQLSLHSNELEEEIEPVGQLISINDEKSDVFSESKSNKNHNLWEICYMQDQDGDTQLHISIMQRFTEATFYLINLTPYPCLLDIRNDDWQAALHVAVLTREHEVVRKLVLAGADLSTRNFHGNTALHLAGINGDILCTKALTEPISPQEKKSIAGRREIKLPQNLELRNFEGKMPIHLAAGNGHIEVIKQLVRSGAKLDAGEGLGGRTALQIAIEHRQREVIQFLIKECGKDHFEAKNYAGETAYQFAIRFDTKIARELLRYGAEEIDASDGEDEHHEFDDSDASEDDYQENEFINVLSKFNSTKMPLSV